MEPINLADACGPLPSGSDIAQGFGGKLVITVEGILSFTSPMRWGVRVETPTKTPSGRKGKSKTLLLLVANDESETPADLLRQLARMWDLGTIEEGKTYPIKPEKKGEDC